MCMDAIACFGGDTMLFGLLHITSPSGLLSNVVRNAVALMMTALDKNYADTTNNNGCKLGVEGEPWTVRDSVPLGHCAPFPSNDKDLIVAINAVIRDRIDFVYRLALLAGRAAGKGILQPGVLSALSPVMGQLDRRLLWVSRAVGSIVVNTAERSERERERRSEPSDVLLRQSWHKKLIHRIVEELDILGLINNSEYESMKVAGARVVPGPHAGGIVLGDMDRHLDVEMYDGDDNEMVLEPEGLLRGILQDAILHMPDMPMAENGVNLEFEMEESEDEDEDDDDDEGEHEHEMIAEHHEEHHDEEEDEEHDEEDEEHDEDEMSEDEEESEDGDEHVDQAGNETQSLSNWTLVPRPGLSTLELYQRLMTVKALVSAVSAMCRVTTRQHDAVVRSIAHSYVV